MKDLLLVVAFVTAVATSGTSLAASNGKPLDDIADDWSALSPRQDCLRFVGLQDNGTAIRTRLPQEASNNQAVAAILRNLDRSANAPFNKGWEDHEYRNRLENVFLPALGHVAAAEKVNTSALQAVADRIRVSTHGLRLMSEQLKR